MIKKVELLPPAGHAGLFAEPTPLGLLGLAVGCAALTPIAFGFGLTPAGLKTAAMFCLLFGGGGQFLCGLMNFANKNLFGGTIFTLFSFNWAMNWWALDGMAEGKMPDHHIVLAVDSLYLLVFLVLTYGFGFFSKLLVAFLVDIDLLYLAKVITGVTGTKALAIPTALLTVGLGLIALWIAFATLINPTAGRPIFKMAGPLFIAPRQKGLGRSARPRGSSLCGSAAGRGRADGAAGAPVSAPRVPLECPLDVSVSAAARPAAADAVWWHGGRAKPSTAPQRAAPRRACGASALARLPACPSRKAWRCARAPRAAAARQAAARRAVTGG
jgi:succinate-acetate transporter protein